MAKVLIVDDNEHNRDLLAYLLRRRGHTPIQASNGATAVACAATERPDLILMDVAMPVLDGHAAARMIRANDDLASTPLIGMSAVYSRLDFRGAEPGLFDAFFQLPLDPSELVERIEQHLPPEQGSG